MKRLALLASLLLSTIALAGALSVNWGAAYTFTACAAGGSASQNVNGGSYLLTVTGSDTTICQAATCATGGSVLPSGSVLLVGVPFIAGGTAFSCRSSASTGNVQFTPAN